MSRKGKRRREERRRRHAVAGAPAGPAHEEGGEQPAQRATRASARPTRPRAYGGGFRLSRQQVQVLAWSAGSAAVLAGIIVFVVLVISSGSSSGSAPEVSVTPDPRTTGTPVATFNIESLGAESGSYYSPNTITAKAGELIEIVVTNNGTVSHNMRVSGPDKEYDTADDFEMPPNVILPGQTQALRVKIDQPGTYPFRCDFHPNDQKGELILQ